jgi:hypothetical protein
MKESSTMTDRPDRIDRPEKQDNAPTSKAAEEVREAVRAAAVKTREAARQTFDKIKTAREQRIADQKEAD